MTILKWALIFLVVSIIAGLLGFTGWCVSTRPQVRNCAPGNLEIPGSLRAPE